MSDINQSPTANNSADLKDIISNYTSYWKWFLISVVFTTIIAYIYIRYAIPKYEVQTQILILEDKNSGSELDVFQDLSFLNGGENKVEDEIQLINSRSNFIEVVKELNLNTKIMVQGNIIESEVYHQPPINLNFISADSTLNKAEFEFFITISSSTTFGYKEEEDAPVKIFAFGKNISTPIGEIVITPNVEVFENYRNRILHVSVKPISLVAQEYRKKNDYQQSR